VFLVRSLLRVELILVVFLERHLVLLIVVRDEPDGVHRGRGFMRHAHAVHTLHAEPMADRDLLQANAVRVVAGVAIVA
jgi:hypothetical protein